MANQKLEDKKPKIKKARKNKKFNYFKIKV